MKNRQQKQLSKLATAKTTLEMYREMEAGLPTNKVVKLLISEFEETIEAIERQFELEAQGIEIQDFPLLIDRIEGENGEFIAWDKRPINKKNKTLTVLKFILNGNYYEVLVHEKYTRSRGLELNYEIIKAECRGYGSIYDLLDGETYKSEDQLAIAEEILRIAGYPQ